ncbi:hypothetical protein LUZ60_014619 [Juncus effusus]|nr:hypothetical protein LUZ60_014619 [Juncus effusus]
METSQNLHESSFSDAWTRSKKPSIDHLDTTSLGHSFNTQDTNSFIEMDPDFFSMRWPSDSSLNLDFTLPSSQPLDLVNTDKIFSYGVIVPSQVDTSISAFSRSESIDSSKSLLTNPKPISASSSPSFYSAQSTPFYTTKVKTNKSPLVRSCADSPKKILIKYLFFLFPLYKKVKGMKLFSRKMVSGKASSMRVYSRRMSSVEWCHGNADTAVYDAVMYCKRSFESQEERDP